MKIALIGYGKMGHAVEAEALLKGHSIVCVADSMEEISDRRADMQQTDVAVEFSQPSAAADNLRQCLQDGIAVVCGTTGWYEQYDSVAALCRKREGRMLTATNFSIGMNIMFTLNKRLAALMAGREQYAASITETHHIHKLDAPSGTALTLQEQIMTHGRRSKNQIEIASIREGEIPGIHTVSYASAEDTITLTHEAHSRRGLAIGAVVAAEWLVAAAPGVYTMNDVLA